MNYQSIFQQLQANQLIFRHLLQGTTKVEYLWKPNPDKWCMLEIICHLYDEEREDFRQRVRLVLHDPGQPLPSINPVGWVTERQYLQQNFDQKLEAFLKERADSVAWLNSLDDPPWHNAYHHPKYGPWSAHHFLVNWLAHDYLHIRQITRLKYDYLQSTANNTLAYAGTWV